METRPQRHVNEDTRYELRSVSYDLCDDIDVGLAIRRLVETTESNAALTEVIEYLMYRREQAKARAR